MCYCQFFFTWVKRACDFPPERLTKCIWILLQLLINVDHCLVSHDNLLWINSIKALFLLKVNIAIGVPLCSIMSFFFKTREPIYWICNVNFVEITFAEKHDMGVGFQIIVFLIYNFKMPIVKLIDIPARCVGHIVFRMLAPAWKCHQPPRFKNVW